MVIPIITYAGETRNPTKNEKTEQNRILDKIIKRILLVPTSTPREALYIETGIMDIGHTTMKTGWLWKKRHQTNPNSLTSKVKEIRTKNGWKRTTEIIKMTLQIEPSDMEGTINQTKGKIKTKVETAQKKTIIDTCKDERKIRHLLNGKQEEWKPGQRAEYMNKLTRKQSSTIIKARRRMWRTTRTITKT